MEFIIFCILIAITIITVIIMTVVTSRKKLIASIIERFGKAPKESDCEFDSIETYHIFKNKLNCDEDSIDDITWNDLDMNKVYERINACMTSIGEEYLYSVLHEPKFKRPVR